MIKKSTALLLFTLLLSQADAQVDSIPTPKNSPRNDSISLPPQNYSLSKDIILEKEPVYKIKHSVDIPVSGAATLFTLYAFTVIYSKDSSTVQEINNLNVNDINSFDRWSIYPYSEKLSNIAAYEFYAAMPLPLIAFLATKNTRDDFWKLTFLYWEAMSITGLFGAGSPYFIDRYRPYAYSAKTPIDKRRSGIAKNSAFSGHVEIVATSVFLTAKVYSDYYPETKVAMYSFATVATGAMGYMRLKGGEHFPTDVLTGAVIGTLAGILVPHFHKQKNRDMSILPFYNGDSKGFTLIYKLK